MKAAIFEEFGKPLSIQNLPDPRPEDDGVVIEVKANGICRSDWHGWMGHDPDIRLPHVPGHELAGIILETGRNVRNWKKGDRVTMPFVCGCGTCPQCLTGKPASMRPPVPARIHALGLLRAICQHPLRRHQPGAPAGRAGFRHRGQPGLPFL